MTEMRLSAVLETYPITPPESPENWNFPYYNLVVLGKTSLSPHELLTELKRIERLLGRDLNAPRWSPRVIDLDILAWDHDVISSKDLVIPHHALNERPFLIQLMASLCPEWRYPVTDNIYAGFTLGEILHRHIKKESLFLKCLATFPQLVGIVNITPDSFSDGGCYFRTKEAERRIQELISQGAAVIDIGAQSTRPGAKSISASEEWNRLEPIFDYLALNLTSQPVRPCISLDSFNPQVIQAALERYPIDWINDVQGNEEPEFLQLVSKTQCKIVINHSLGIPPSKERILPFDSSPIEYICEWAQRKINLFKTYGVEKDRIIIDPGIGFGKSMSQSLMLLRDIKKLMSLDCEVLIGHSRKSFLDFVSLGNYSERDLETVGVSSYLYRQGVDYLRVHNVELHHRVLASLTALEGFHAL